MSNLLWRTPVKRAFHLAAAVLALNACKDPVDQAAKKRIFSAEDPPQAVAAASQKLPPENVADSIEMTRRVLGMGAAETTERVGAHAYKANISWEWTTAGVPNVRLKETRELLAGPGGISGDFSVKVYNDKDQGLELLRAKGKVYARPTYGKDGAGRWRERRRDRGMGERMREESFAGVKDFDSLFRGRLKLTAAGTESVESRTAWKYSVALAEGDEPETKKLPPLKLPDAGVDETTARRMAFYSLRKPIALQGEVFVDLETSVVLRTRLDGRMSVSNPDAGTAELRMVLESSLTGIGHDPQLKAPDDFLPDEDKPLGIAAALKRFGIVRTDGGTAPGPGAELPDDSDAP